ncbi:MAG: hypothetical protein ACFE8V_11490, partial [Promethearchaeota archaeon]
IPILLIFNKVDKISNREKTQIISFFIESAKQYGIEIVYLDEFIKDQNEQIIPYLDFSAIRKINLGKLNHFISSILSQRLS